MGKQEIEQYQLFHPFMMKTFDKKGCMFVKITSKDFGLDLYSKPSDDNNNKSKKLSKKKQKQALKEAIKRQKQQKVQIEEQLNENFQQNSSENQENLENTENQSESGELNENENQNQITEKQEKINQLIQNQNYKLKRLKHFELKKYFLFRKYDQGCQLDEESWYSLIPEPISEYIASKVKCPLLIDGFCGAGGTLIQLAKNCDKVIANDIDPEKISMAKNNTQIYGVSDKIEFKNQSFLDFEKDIECDCVLACPPWGGVEYFKNTFDLTTGITPDFSKILEKCLQMSHNVVMQLPKNLELRQLVSMIWDALKATKAEMTNMRLECELMKVNGNPNQIIVYFGNFASIYDNQEYQMLYNILDIQEKEDKEKLKQKLKNGEAVDIYELIAKEMEFDQDSYYENLERANKLEKEKKKQKEQEELEKNNLEKQQNEENFVYNGKKYSSKDEMENAKKEHQALKKRQKRQQKKLKRKQYKKMKIEEIQEDEETQNILQQFEQYQQKDTSIPENQSVNNNIEINTQTQQNQNNENKED